MPPKRKPDKPKSPAPAKPQPQPKRKKKPGKKSTPQSMPQPRHVRAVQAATNTMDAQLRRLAYGIALPEASKPLRLPDMFPSETRVLGFTQSMNLELVHPTSDPELGIESAHGLFVVSRQPSRPFLTRTATVEPQRVVFFQRGGILSDASSLDPHGVPRTRSVPETTGPAAAVLSPYDEEFFLPVVGATEDVSESATPDGYPTHVLAPGAKFQHVGVMRSAYGAQALRRGLFLSAGSQVTITVRCDSGDGRGRPLSGQGLPLQQRLANHATGGVTDYTAAPFDNLGSVLTVSYRLVPLGSSVNNDPTDFVEGADGNNHYPDGTVEGSRSDWLGSTHSTWTGVAHVTGYYQICCTAVSYTVNLPAGYVLSGGFPPLVAHAAIGPDLHPIARGSAAPSVRWVSVIPDDLDGRDTDLLGRARITGVGLLCKNLSNLLQVGGVFYGRRSLNSSVESLRDASADVQSLDRSSSSGMVRAREGLYTWLPPTPDDEEFRLYADRYGVPLYYVDILSPQHVVLLHLPGDSLANASFLCIQNLNLEFVTPLQRYGPADITPFGVEAMSRLRHAISRYPLFLDNPVHIRKLVQTLGSAMRGAAHYLKHNQAYLQPLVSSYNPTAGEVFRALRMLM